MSVFVYLTVLTALANCIALMSSAMRPYRVEIFIGLVLVAIQGLIFPGREKMHGRVVTVLALLLGGLPLLHEPIKAHRLRMKERAYALEIAPLQSQWQSATRDFTASMAAWHARKGNYPIFENGRAVDPAAAPGASTVPGGFPTAPAPPSEASSGTFSLPPDPFRTGSAPADFWTDSRATWIVISLGPDKQPNLVVPPLLRPMDQTDPAARWIAMNPGDPGTRLYNPADGSLGLGDLVVVNGSSEATEAFFERMGQAWSDASLAITNMPASGGSEAERAALAAKTLLNAGNALAALAAANRSIAKIPPLIKDQRVEDYLGRRILGEALYALGDPRMAASALAAYLELNPNDAEAHYWMGAALYYSGDTAQARREFAAASQIEPHGPLARSAWDALNALGKSAMPQIPSPGFKRKP